MGGLTPTPERLKYWFVDWYNKNVADFDVSPMTLPETYVVWFSYILGDAKCLISTTREDHHYYELTYNSKTNELYVDRYVKVSNDSVNLNVR